MTRPRYNKFSPEHTQLIMKAIRSEMKAKEVSGPMLAFKIGFTAQALRNWATGFCMLNMHNLQLMADALEITPGEIVRAAHLGVKP